MTVNLLKEYRLCAAGLNNQMQEMYISLKKMFSLPGFFGPLGLDRDGKLLFVFQNANIL